MPLPPLSKFSAWMVPGRATGEPVYGPEPPPPPVPAPVVNENVEEGPMSVGSTSVANVRDTTFQKYFVEGCSAWVTVYEYFAGGFSLSTALTRATLVMLLVLVPRYTSNVTPHGVCFHSSFGSVDTSMAPVAGALSPGAFGFNG